MLNSLRRSFGMSPSSSNIQADYIGNSDVPAGVLSPSNRPNTFIPLRRSNSFTNFFSSSRPTSPVKDNVDHVKTNNAVPSPITASSTGAHQETQEEPVLAYLVLLDKKGREKQRYPIQSLTTTMGRAEDNDVRFLASEISRHHCTIEIQIEPEQTEAGTTAFLQVLGANGVLLNGVQALPAPRGAGRYELHTGDAIVVAKRSFTFELPLPTSSQSETNLFASPVKDSTQSAVSQTPAKSNRRRVRMSLVNAAQIDTPARPSAGSSRQAASPTKANNAEREARRADGLQRFMQSVNVSPSKANKNKARQSLTSSTSVVNLFATPVKGSRATVEPKTAPPKQVSFSLYSNSYSGRLSPVKQMRMMPPLDTMNEEQDASFHSDFEQPQSSDVVQETPEEQESPDMLQDNSSEDIVIVEELEREPEPVEMPVTEVHPASMDGPTQAEVDAEDSENMPPSAASGSSTPSGSPSKGGSPKRAKRRSSFFGRAGPFRGISLGFYAEERTEPDQPAPEVQAAETEPEQQAEQAGEHAEEFSDASDVEPTPMDDEDPATLQADESPVARRVCSKQPRMLGISKTPSPVKKQHFVGLTPLPRRPRLSLTTRRRVSLRTQTLLRSSEAYADRLFLPPPPPTPSSPGPSGLSKSMSMPTNLSGIAPMQPPPAFDASSSFELEHNEHEEDLHSEAVQDVDFESQLDPALSEEEPEPEPWKDSEDDEDEVDQSLSVLLPSPPKAPVHNFSPVQTSTLPKFATPQPVSKSHARRISMPPAGAADAKPSIRSTLVRLQISGAGERIVHETARKSQDAEDSCYSQQSSPTKARKVVRVSDVGLPATEVSMGFDLVQDSASEQESEKIAEALNDLFTAEEDELTDDEVPAEEEEEEEEEEDEEQEAIVQISSKLHESPSRPMSVAVAPLQPPQTPAALNSVRHLFSAASAAPATPDMHGLASMLHTGSPEKPPQYGTLGDRMRANPEIVELLSPVKSSPQKKDTSKSSPVKSSPAKSSPAKSSPVKGRRGVRRSEAAELLLPLPATPRALASRSDLPSPAVTPLPESVVAPPLETAPVPPAFEAELHVTMFDATAMDAENEAIAQAIAQAQEDAASEAAELEQAVQHQQQAEFEQQAQLEKALAQQFAEEVQFEETVVEEPLPPSGTEEVAPIELVAEVDEPVREVDTAAEVASTEVVPEALAEKVPAPVATPVLAEECMPANSTEDQVPVEASPSKTRASRRATSASPTKRTARSASPTKRAVHSSPVKRAPATAAEVFAEESAAEAPVEELAAEPAAEVVTEQPAVQPQDETKAQPEPETLEPESLPKPTRRTTGRKAKQAATEAISATLVPEVPQASPEKPARRARALAAKKPEVEEAQPVEETSEAEEEEVEVEQAPKRATRARAPRAAATAAKPVRATRTRAAKSSAAALPSSSAGYGDDEASEVDEAAATTKAKRTTATRTRTTTTARGKTTRTTKAAVAAAVAVVESSEAEDHDQEPSSAEEQEPEEAPAPKTRTRATRAKATTATSSTATKGRAKTKAEADDATASSSAATTTTTTTTTTRSGRTTRRTVAAK